jgi:transcriptional regulator with XRE-family HTH domain
VSGHKKFSSRSAKIASDATRASRMEKSRLRLREEHERYEAGLAQIRKARESTQVELARLLGISQPEVSRVERQADVYLSTLRRYIEALGGDLRVMACFDDREVEVVLENRGELPAGLSMSEASGSTQSNASIVFRDLPVTTGIAVTPELCVSRRGDLALAA